MKSRIFLSVLYLYALLFSVVRTVRFPNDWAEAHWLMDYRFGIIKRGLGGEIFGFFFNKNEINITVLSSAILAILYLVLLIIAFKESVRERISVSKILYFVTFFLCQYTVFSAHLIGYFDHLIFLMTILSVYLIRKRQIFTASIIAGISIFIHEISFFLLIPVSVFALIISRFSIDHFSFRCLIEKFFLKKLILFLALPLISIFILFYVQEFHLNLYHAQVFNYLKGFKFISEAPADSVSSGFTKSFAYQWDAQSPHFFQRVFVSTCTVFYGIPMAFMLFLMFKLFNLKKNVSFFLVIFCIGFCPLLLHAVAYDTYRIWTFPYMILFLMFWIINSSESTAKKNIDLKRSDFIIFIISVFLMVFTPLNLFDNEVENLVIFHKIIITLCLLLILYLNKRISDKNLRLFA